MCFNLSAAIVNSSTLRQAILVDSDTRTDPAHIAMPTRQLFDMQGKIVLITGAAGGIGRCLAQGFGRAGGEIALSDIREDEVGAVAAKLRDEGISCRTFPSDLSDVANCTQLVDSVVEAFGRLDVLVNSATYNVRKPILDITQEEYRRILAINLDAPYFLSQVAARYMIARGKGGRIIHLSSVNKDYGLSGVSVYGLAKAALVQHVKVQAVEWAKAGILCNCIAPGFIQTPLTEPLVADPVRYDWILRHTPAGRIGQPEELIGTALLLASEAGSFINGQTIVVDGGFPGSDWTEA
jgi:NAD(P)-dependent dehydrogenase (short-subunit alcohol dehydrogenase family)